MSDLAISARKSGGIPIWALKPTQIRTISTRISSHAAQWAKAAGFVGAKGQLCLVPGKDNNVDAVLYGLGNSFAPMDTARLARLLPRGEYRFEYGVTNLDLATLGWCLGAYQFNKYKTMPQRAARLVADKTIDIQSIRSAASATCLARDLINTPANDLGPEELELAVRTLAKSHKASVKVIKGEALLKQNFPMIHAVGRASASAPRLIDMHWGALKAPKVTLVGKGVSFDTGGLNIKPGNSMTLMKKDMGGAANVLGLAAMIMDAKLPVRLRVLIPAVENSISSNAFRPGDILESRKGLSVEIGNTDAEGRLILGDALCLADEERPELLIDMATLTGAARVALGPDLPPFYTHDDILANDIASAAENLYDPLWRMPLWQPYNSLLASKTADINHITSGGFAGSVTAALFLSRFVSQTKSWVHLDVFGWVPAEKPWAQIGGEAQGIRALFHVINKRYAK
ncbi:MAG: leucyl aminopeptidase family protein [Rhizobiaceae bacterium]|nr:leucyl aminopeptidase family protein [Rhizobiaceae bacterium]